MTNTERAIVRACMKADARFQEDGATGTKTWAREYFLPAFKAEGLTIEQAPEKKEPVKP